MKKVLCTTVMVAVFNLNATNSDINIPDIKLSGEKTTTVTMPTETMSQEESDIIMLADEIMCLMLELTPEELLQRGVDDETFALLNELRTQKQKNLAQARKTLAFLMPRLNVEPLSIDEIYAITKPIQESIINKNAISSTVTTAETPEEAYNKILEVDENVRMRVRNFNEVAEKMRELINRIRARYDAEYERAQTSEERSNVPKRTSKEQLEYKAKLDPPLNK